MSPLITMDRFIANVRHSDRVSFARIHGAGNGLVSALRGYSRQTTSFAECVRQLMGIT